MPGPDKDQEPGPEQQAQAQQNASPEQLETSQGADKLNNFLGDLLQSFLKDNTKQDASTDQKTTDSLQEQVQSRMDDLTQSVNDLGKTEPAEQDKDLAGDLADSMKEGTDLDAVRQQIDQSSEQARKAIETPIDREAPEATQDKQVADRNDARERMEWLDGARDVVDAAEAVRGVRDQVQQIRDEMQNGGSPEEARKAMNQLNEQLTQESVAEEAERRKRISQEMTGGEVDF